MLTRWKRAGFAFVLAGQVGGWLPSALAQQPAHQPPARCATTGSCADLQVPKHPYPSPPPVSVSPVQPDATTPPTMPPDATTPPTMPPDTTPPTMPPDTTPPTMPPDAAPPISPPDTSADLTAPDASSLSFDSQQAGVGSVDVAFSGTPGMIGDLFTVGSGQMNLPLIIGRGILHADSVNGQPTFVGINDFHLIDESQLPTGFQGGGGGSSRFFIVPADYVFGRQPNGDPIQPGMVTGLQGFNLTQYGFPEGTSDDAFVFTATQTPDRVTVQDQQSPDVFPGAPVYVITRGDGSSPVICIPTGSPSTGGVIVGRQKSAENTSPIPRDRVFMSYSYFDNTPLFPGGVNVNRFSPGFEKTFLDGNASLEARFPFATTLDSDLVADGFTDTSHLEFGNIYMALKALLYTTDTIAVSGGLAMILPTGDDVNVTMANGTSLVRIENESVHVMPFLGGLYAPNDRVFAQGFLQCDFDANGNPVHLNRFGNGLREAGTANDATYLFADIGLGYWLYKNTDGGSWLTGIAPTVELHYNRSLQDSDVIQSGLFQIGSFQKEVQNLNALLGGTVQLGDSTTLTAAYVTPVGNGADQFFDGEARVSFNWFFGRSSGGNNLISPFGSPLSP